MRSSDWSSDLCSSDLDGLWMARGGWGAARIVDMVLPRLNRAAHGESYMGYSDAGTLLAALYARGIGRQFHGPMPVDIVREGGEAAVVQIGRGSCRDRVCQDA